MRFFHEIMSGIKKLKSSGDFDKIVLPRPDWFMDGLKIVKMITFSVRIKAKKPENRVFTPFSGHKKWKQGGSNS